MAQSPKDRSADAGPYRIQVAASLSGVPAATLRAWERRYGVPVPRRTTTAYRLYTADDIALVRRMNELVSAGTAPSDAARAVLGSEPGQAHVEAPVMDGLELARARILAATQRWDGQAIDDELARIALLLDAQTLYTRVIGPLLEEVGNRWAEGNLSVAQEHLLSEKIELVLRAALRTLERPDGPLALTACIDGEDHVLGLLGASLRLAASGFRIVILGAATPPEALGEAVRSMAPRLVGLSVTRPPPQPKTLFRAYAKAIGPTPWVVGGPVAEDVAAAVTAAGGVVAVGAGAAWQNHVRDWLRGGGR